MSQFNPAITREQREALARVFSRNDPLPDHPLNKKMWLRRYRAFRKTARYSHLMGCVMVEWSGMMLGIEADGHTHS